MSKAKDVKRDDRLLRPDAVKEKTGLSRTTLWRLEKRGAFPARRHVGGNMVGWLESEIDAWLAGLPLREGDEDDHREESTPRGPEVVR